MIPNPLDEIRHVKLALSSLSVYRRLLQDEVISRLYALLDCFESDEADLEGFVNRYSDFFYVYACKCGASLEDYIVEAILFDENPYTLAAEVGELDGSSSLERAAANDLNRLQIVSMLPPSALKALAIEDFCNSDFETGVVESLPEWVRQGSKECEDFYPFNMKEIKKEFFYSLNWVECVHNLTGFYKEHGCGMLLKFSAFIWDNCDGEFMLRGIHFPDPIRLSDLVGYEAERAEVISNTEQFLKGFPANNLLLYGDRGTGKSSTVKAILNEYSTRGLRMIEVPKKYLVDFPNIVRELRGRKYKFIIFVDDLAFEDSEESYTALKAVLEGGLESRPENVLIYATSNRRHLIKEKFSDRAGLQTGVDEDEIRAQDTIQEKLSLSDRFGVTVVFSSPDKEKYLQIVEGIAASRGLKINKERLHKEALKWELWYNGRSPRTAKQFVDWLEGQTAQGASI